MKLRKSVPMLMVPLIGATMGVGQDMPGPGIFLILSGLVCALLLTVPLRPRRGFLLGWLLGVGYFVLSMRWIVEPFFVDPLRHGWMAPFAITGMAGGLALFWGGAFAAAAYFVRPPALRIFSVTLGLWGAEALRSFVLTGFPWALISYPLIGAPHDVIFAWVGPFGAVLAISLTAAMVALAIHLRSWQPVAIAIFSVISVWGVRVFFPHEIMPVSEPVARIRIVQPNAQQDQKWDPVWIERYFEQTLDAVGADPPPDLVILPETALPTVLERADGMISELARAGRGAEIVAGILRFSDQGGLHNSLILIDDAGSVLSIYDKRHLVPFGEYVPFKALFTSIGLTGVVDEMGTFSPGQGGGIIPLEGLGLSRVLICYEGIFPQEILVEGNRPDALVIITNDAWFGNGAGPRQHLLQARARAIETGLPVYRAANTGISAVIGPDGRILQSLELNTYGYIDVSVPPRSYPATLYSVVGDMPVYLFAAFLFFGLLILQRRFTG